MQKPSQAKHTEQKKTWEGTLTILEWEEFPNMTKKPEG